MAATGDDLNPNKVAAELPTESLIRANPTRRRILGGAAALIVAGIGAGSGVLAHGGNDDEDEDQSGPGGGHDDEDHHGPPPEQSTQVADVTTVRIVDERFEPNNILIETGQTVTWENQDDDQHTASGRAMDTGVINPGSKGTVTFLEPGELQLLVQLPSRDAWPGHGHRRIEGDAPGKSGSQPSRGGHGACDQDHRLCIRSREGDFRSRRHGDLDQHRKDAAHDLRGLGEVGHPQLWRHLRAHIRPSAGTFEYQCGLHPAMVGTIEVVDMAGAES